MKQTEILFYKILRLEVFHKSVFNYQKYFVLKDFCLLSTNKMKNQDNEEEFNIIKIDGEGKTEIGSFKSLVDMKCKGSPDVCGKYILVNLSTSYVKNSYFASTILYLYDVQNNSFERVNKLSNILDFVFIKNGFCVIYGNQPAYVTSFNYDLTLRDKFPKGVRNRVYFNHQQTHIVLAGFEQLAGNVEPYDVKSKEKFSSANELSASKIKWDITGSYYYVSTLKYLKEDNRITMYDYYGRKVDCANFDCLSNIASYGALKEFVVLPAPTEKFVEVQEEAYVPAILKGNMIFKVKTSPKPKVVNKVIEETEEDLLIKLANIEEYIKKKWRIMKNYKLKN